MAEALGAAPSPLERLRALAAQPAVRRALPWAAGAAALGGAALTWALLAPAPQRVLYAQLDDAQRAGVVEALDKGAITYRIDNATGALTVGEDDLYRARMLVASDGGLATPDGGQELIAALPLGASRTLEGEQLRAARERELMLTIREIDGVEAVRVHLAEGERSAFVRDNFPPSASVMLRLARGRQLSDSQVSGIVNLVSGSVPGLALDAVKVVDQHGRLLSALTAAGDADRVALQGSIEDKLRGQLAQLLSPMLGEDGFSTQVQVELDMDQVTSARESYDKQGVLRTESASQSQSSGGTALAGGVPGVLSNTPPPQTVPSPGPPAATPAPGATAPAAPASPTSGESNTTRTYELGREVAVANSTPGKIKRLSVAVALSAAAMKGSKGGDLDQIKQLVSAAVGADTSRGDQVTVMVRKFDPRTVETAAFYDAPWFAAVVRNAVALIAVVLVLLLGVRPLIKALRREPAGEGSAIDGGLLTGETSGEGPPRPSETRLLGEQVDLAKRFAAERPETATLALRRMLEAPANP